MKSMSNKKGKMELGKKTEEGYKYTAKIDFGQDISTQISRVMKEKEINEIIEKEVEDLRKVVKEFPTKEKNLQYYYEIGKKLLFLDSDTFKDVAPNSVFRRVVEELPEILPDLDITSKNDRENACKHVSVMYELAHVDREDLSKASWDQWYEIGKFTGICKDTNFLEQILAECKSKGLSGISLRRRINDLRNQRKYPRF